MSTPSSQSYYAQLNKLLLYTRLYIYLRIPYFTGLSHLAAISTFFRLGGLPPNQTPIGLGSTGGHLGGR
jgi:hypothetical protein